MKTTSLNYALALALVAIACAVFIVHPAFAQVVAGGAGAQAFTSWVTSAAGLGSLVALAVALAGIVLMFGQHSWVALGFLIAGALIFANATTIGGYFGGGGVIGGVGG